MSSESLRFAATLRNDEKLNKVQSEEDPVEPCEASPTSLPRVLSMSPIGSEAS